MTTEVATLIARLRADASGYVSGTTEAIAANDKLAASHQKVLSTASEVGGALSKYVTLPILAAGAASVKLSMDFDEAFAHVSSASKLPAAAIDSLKSKVLALASASGQSPTTLADTLVQIERSGVGASHAVDVLTVSAKLAATGLASQSNAADVLTSVMNAYGPSVISAAHAGDILATGAETSKISVDDLSSSLGRALPAAAALGVSFQDLVTAESVMTKEGLSAGQAGMSLFRILSSIENPTVKGAAAMKDLGLSIGDAQQMIASGNFIGLLAKIGENSAGNQQAILQLTGGIRGAAGAFALSAQSGKALADEQKRMMDSSGSLNDLMGKVAGTAGFQLRQAFTSVEAALIKWGDAFAPVAKGLADLIKAGADLVGFIGQINAPMKDTIVITLALAASIGPLILIAGGLAKAFIAIKEGAEIVAAWAAKDAAADQIAGEAAATRAVQEGVLTDALLSKVEAEGLAAGGSAAQLAFPGMGGLASQSVSTGEQMALPGLETAGIVAASTETTAASGGLLSALGGLALVAAPVVASFGLIQHAIDAAGKSSRDSAADVKNLTTTLGGLPTASASQQNKVWDDLHQRIQVVLNDQKEYASHIIGGTGAQPKPGDVAASVTQTASAVGAIGGTPNQDADLRHLKDVHDAMAKIMEDQGNLAAKPFFDKLIAEAGKVPGGLALINSAFGDLIAKADAAQTAATASLNKFASTVGVDSLSAASAVKQYDAAMSSATGITDDTTAAGERAAIALSKIGVAAGFAAQATVNGMSTAQIAVAGLMNSIQAGLAADSSTDSLFSSLSGLQAAQSESASGSGIGGGAGGQTAAAAALDHSQKELAVRDAQRQVAQAATAVQTATVQLAQARQSSTEATEASAAAELNYEQVLHGVVAGAILAKASTEDLAAARQKATEASLAFQQAQNDTKSAQLDVNAAQRGVATAKNDKQSYAFAVEDAKRQLALDSGQGGDHQQFAPGYKGSYAIQGTGGAQQAETVAKDQMALRDALIAQKGANDSVTSATLTLSDAEIAQKQKSIDLANAHKSLNDTLYGYAKNSHEAQDAQNQLTDAQNSAASSALGVVSAAQSLQSAQDNIATSALGLQRAELDLAGQLTNTGGAAGAFHNKALDVKQAADQAKASIYDWAQKQADASGQLKGSAGWAQVFIDKLNFLKNLLHPSGDLATFLNLLIGQFTTLENPVALGAGGAVSMPGGAPKPGGGAQLPGGQYHRATGGSVVGGQSYWVGEYGAERFTPRDSGVITPHGMTSDGTGAGATVIHHHTAQLTVQSLDPSTAAPLVIKVLRDWTDGNGSISGVAVTK